VLQLLGWIAERPRTGAAMLDLEDVMPLFRLP
jgi:hypothetical protein